MPYPADLRDAASSPAPAYGLAIDELMSMLAIGDAPEPAPAGAALAAFAAAPPGAQSLGSLAGGSDSASTSRRGGSTTISRGSHSGLQAEAEGDMSLESGAAASDSSTDDAFEAGQQQHVRLRAMADAAQAASAARRAEEQQRQRSERALVRSPWSHCCAAAAAAAAGAHGVIALLAQHSSSRQQRRGLQVKVLLQPSMHAACSCWLTESICACLFTWPNLPAGCIEQTAG